MILEESLVGNPLVQIVWQRLQTSGHRGSHETWATRETTLHLGTDWYTVNCGFKKKRHQLWDQGLRRSSCRDRGIRRKLMLRSRISSISSKLIMRSRISSKIVLRSRNVVGTHLWKSCEWHYFDRAYEYYVKKTFQRGKKGRYDDVSIGHTQIDDVRLVRNRYTV